MPKRMHISTSYNKGISSTAIVQCAAACKWLQPGSGLVDAFLTGRQPAQRRAYNWRIVMSRTTAHTVSPFTKATPRKINQRGKKRSRSMILTDTPVNNDLDAVAAKVKRTTGRKVARTFVPKKELKSGKIQKDTEEESCQ